MKNYQVTIGYKSVLTIDVKADSENEAKKIAVEVLTKEKDKMYSKRTVNLQDDNFKADGVLDMDSTWNMFN